MSFPLRPKRAQLERPEPQFSGSRNAGPAAPARTAVEPARADGAAPLRFPGERRRERETNERPLFSAGERLVVSSVIAGGERTRRRGVLRPVALTVLCLLAAVGAVTIYHSLAGAFPH
jgi:hypothetical protein